MSLRFLPIVGAPQPRLAALALLSGLALSSAPAGAAETLADATRIVTIGAAVTETAYALGAGDRIVGVDTTSVYPADALRTKPNVGYMRALSAEGVLSLKPSGVIAVEGSGPPGALKLVADAGVPVISVPDAFTPAGAAAKIETVGALIGRAGPAKALAEETTARFASLAAARATIKAPVRVLFVLSLQNGRPMVAGRKTAADAAIGLAGAVNAAADIEGYKPMTDEALAAAAPDVVLKMTNGAMVGSPDEMFALPGFARTPAAAKRALIGMDGPYLLGFGPREPDALRDLMAALYPDLKLPELPRLASHP